jgi:2-polyprenyl-3-methyl-5-hydroxy-6-metoxy-1,4-benzoquinol methylase
VSDAAGHDREGNAQGGCERVYGRRAVTVRGLHATRAAFRAWRSYRGAPARTRAFLAARLAVLPLRPLAAEFAELHGRVLAVGSGHGLLERWLAELNPGVTVDGSDLDGERVALAASTQARAPRVRIHHRDVRSVDEREAFDAAVAIDLLHHVPSADHEAVARTLAHALKPGGVVLIKDIARTPRWRHGFNSLHDRLVTGERETFCREPEEMAAVFEAEGFRTERCYRVAPLSPYPHFILRLRRVAASD